MNVLNRTNMAGWKQKISSTFLVSTWKSRGDWNRAGTRWWDFSKTAFRWRFVKVSHDGFKRPLMWEINNYDGSCYSCHSLLTQLFHFCYNFLQLFWLTLFNCSDLSITIQKFPLLTNFLIIVFVLFICDNWFNWLTDSKSSLGLLFPKEEL